MSKPRPLQFLPLGKSNLVIWFLKGIVSRHILFKFWVFRLNQYCLFDCWSFYFFYFFFRRCLKIFNMLLWKSWLIPLILPKAASAAMKKFQKAASSRLNRFPITGEVEFFAWFLNTVCVGFQKHVHVAISGFGNPFDIIWTNIRAWKHRRFPVKFG
jgi:hypothetical protein